MEDIVIRLGMADGGIDVYYPMCHEQENGHIILLGKSGSGKSVAKEEIKKQLGEYGKIVIEIDYSDSTLWRKNPDNAALYIDVKNDNKIFLFERYYQENGCPELDVDYCSRIAGIISRRCKFREKQKALLIKLSMKCLKKYKEEYVNIQMLINELSESEDSTEISIFNKLVILSHIKPFNSGDNCWNWIFNNENKNIVLDLSKFNIEHRALVTELLLENLKQYLQQNKPGKYNFQLILDECKELGCDTGMPLDFLLTQGRKYGCGLLLATQTLLDFDRKTRSKLLQASLILNFNPAFNEVSSVAKMITDKRNSQAKIEQILSELKKGECIATGRFLNELGQVTGKYSLNIKIQTKLV